MTLPICRLWWPALLFLAGCRPPADDLPVHHPACTFTFYDCFPVDPCANEDFSLHELLVIEGQGLFLETSVPYSEVRQLGFAAPGIGFALPAALLDGQLHPPGSPHFIHLPIADTDAFWPAFTTASAAGVVLWSGEIAYQCPPDVRPVPKDEVGR